MLHYGRPILGAPDGFGVDVGFFGAGGLGLDAGLLFPFPPEFPPLDGLGELVGLV
jgi:hypothetical protein